MLYSKLVIVVRLLLQVPYLRVKPIFYLSLAWSCPAVLHLGQASLPVCSWGSELLKRLFHLVTALSSFHEDISIGCIHFLNFLAPLDFFVIFPFELHKALSLL